MQRFEEQQRATVNEVAENARRQEECHHSASVEAAARHADAIAQVIASLGSPATSSPAAGSTVPSETPGEAKQGTEPSARHAKPPPLLCHEFTFPQFERWYELWDTFLQMSQISRSAESVKLRTLFAYFTLHMLSLIHI